MAARLPAAPPRGAPLENSCAVTRNHTHQQPLYPPRSQPNRATRSSHRARVTGRTFRSGNGPDDPFLKGGELAQALRALASEALDELSVLVGPALELVQPPWLEQLDVV